MGLNWEKMAAHVKVSWPTIPGAVACWLNSVASHQFQTKPYHGALSVLCSGKFVLQHICPWLWLYVKSVVPQDCINFLSVFLERNPGLYVCKILVSISIGLGLLKILNIPSQACILICFCLFQ